MSRQMLVVGLAVMVGACAPFAHTRPVDATPDAVVGRVTESAAVEPDSEPPSVVVRTFRGSPYVNVLAWGGDDARFGLRSSLREDGSVARGFHSLFFSASVLRQFLMRSGGDWSVFPVGSDQGRVFAVSGWFNDVHACEGPLGCTPFEVVTARVEDDLLRRSATTGLEVRVRGRTANDATVLTLSPVLVSAYLAKFDSVSNAQRAAAR